MTGLIVKKRSFATTINGRDIYVATSDNVTTAMALATATAAAGVPAVVGDSWYIFRDLFTTNIAAGLLNGTAAEPGPGTRRVTDTNTLMQIGRSYLWLGATMATDNVWNDPDLYYTVSSEIGAILFQWEMQGSIANGMSMIISPTDRPADPTATGLGVYTQENTTATDISLRSCISKLLISSATRLRSIRYNIYIVRRPTAGAWIIISGGIYGSGTLLWIEDTDDISTTNYVGFSSKFGQLYMDGVTAVKASKLAAPYLTDYGPSIAYDTFTRADGTNIGSTEGGSKLWVEIGNGASISGGKLICANSGGAIINVGELPRIIDANVTVPASGGMVAKVYFRCGSSGDRTDTLEYYVDNDNGYLFINGANQGGSGNGGLVEGQVNRLRVVDWGDRVRVYTNNLLCFDKATATNYDASHQYAGVYVIAGPAGYGYNSFIVWPNTVTPPAIFSNDVIGTPCVGSGTAIFSDAFTNTNGTLLTVHNAGYTESGTGHYEINANKARMTADGTDGDVVFEAGTADHEVSANITTPNTEPADGNDEWFCGLVARYTDANNRIYCRLIYTSDREIELWQSVGGNGLMIQMIKFGAGNLEKATTYAVKLACKGNEVCVYVDGVLMGQSRTDLLTGTKAGLHCSAVGGTSNRAIWDDLTIKAT